MPTTTDKPTREDFRWRLLAIKRNQKLDAFERDLVSEYERYSSHERWTCSDAALQTLEALEAKAGIKHN